MIKGFIFDYGGVLGSDADNWNSNFKKISEITGLSNKELKKIGNLHWKKINIGKENLLHLLKNICEVSKKKVKISTIKKIYEEGISINKEVLSFIKNLNEKRFHIAILSNESKEGMNMKIKKFKLNKIFSKIYCSAFLGIAKPNKKIFSYVLNDIGFKANEIVFIDDRKENIISAEKLGIKSILFKDLEKLKKDLNKII